MSDVKTGRRARYAELTRTAVLDAAKELFVSKGFEATSVDEIARLSETSKGAVYHHFRDKREIFAEVFHDTQATIVRSAIDEFMAAGDPWEVLGSATRSFLRTYAEDESARTLLRQAIEVLGWDRVRALDDQTALPGLRALLAKYTESGAIIPVPPEAAAKILFCLYCDAVLFIAAEDTDADAMARDIEVVVSALLRGLRPAGPDPA